MIVYSSQLGKKTLPAPFAVEISGGNGIRLHHKFVVIDFNTLDARVYLDSNNFSKSADGSNGENLLLIKDGKIATSYVVAAHAMFVSLQLQIAMNEAKQANKMWSLQSLHVPLTNGLGGTSIIPIPGESKIVNSSC